MAKKKNLLRPVVLQFRATKEEARWIREGADVAQVTVSEYLRGAAILMARWQVADQKQGKPIRQAFLDYVSMMDAMMKRAS